MHTYVDQFMQELTIIRKRTHTLNNFRIDSKVNNTIDMKIRDHADVTDNKVR